MPGSSITFRVRVVVTVLVLMLALLLPTGYAIPTPGSNELAGSSEESPPTSWTAYVYTITYADPPPSFRLPLSIRYPKTYKNLKSAEAIKLEDEKEAKLKQVKEKVDNLIKAGMCHLLKAEYKGAFEAKNALTLVRTPKDKWYPSYESGPSIEYHAKIHLEVKRGMKTSKEGKPILSTGVVAEDDQHDWLITVKEPKDGEVAVRKIEAELGVTYPVVGGIAGSVYSAESCFTM
ncbi:hypothetical protein FB446DRAFT_206713 [Lentinula raphanica]|nr:hypothetical protein FB446DRAFT_206713 [Lentinula raphanica]